MEAGCDLRDVGWEPAVVVWCPVAKGQRLLVQAPPPAHLVKEPPTSLAQDPAKLHPCLMGVWRDVLVDPNAWAIGPLPVSHFVVKSAARRKLLLDMQAADPDFSVAYVQRPRLWPCFKAACAAPTAST
jgi:hypothetical protein